MPKVDLICLDLDGTLMHDLMVSPVNHEALEEAQRAGIRVAIVTGRPYVFARELMRSKGLTVTVMAANGAQSVDMKTGEELILRRMAPAAARRLIAYAGEHGILIHVFTSKGFASSAEDRAILQYRNVNRGLPPEERMEVVVADHRTLLENYGEDALKVTLMEDDPEKLFRLQRELSGEDAQGERSWHNMLEFMGRGMCKGWAVKKLAEKLSIPLERVMAVGDHENDLTMIEAAGVSVAMGNAIDSVKAAARHTTLTCLEDGVAHAIRRWAL